MKNVLPSATLALFLLVSVVSVSCLKNRSDRIIETNEREQWHLTEYKYDGNVSNDIETMILTFAGDPSNGRFVEIEFSETYDDLEDRFFVPELEDAKDRSCVFVLQGNAKKPHTAFKYTYRDNAGTEHQYSTFTFGSKLEKRLFTIVKNDSKIQEIFVFEKIKLEK